MGAMTIIFDDALSVALKRPKQTGAPVEQVGADVGLSNGASRMAGSRAILARCIPSPITSVDLLDQIRDEGR
jgi:hypothetical protein